MADIKANDYISDYKILSKYSEGGMALIYKALQPSLKRTVIIKKLKDPNREIIRRFKKEALISASFHQENLVAIYDFLYIDRAYYLVMEFVDGEDLRTVIDHTAPLPAYLAALIVLGIARGLEYTHARNIIHRDIKPSNILISYGGDVKLIDFGVAKDDISTRLTMTGMIVGTPAYMSPEQANGDPLSARSDLFSLGILLYEMLTGVKPFYGENNTEILAKIVRNRYVPPERINPRIPFRLRRIIKKALRKDPARRYRNATELIHDLELFIPWQLRSRRKEQLADFLSRMDKTKTNTFSENINLSLYSGRRLWTWRLLRGAVAAAALYLIGFLSWQFRDHQLGYLNVLTEEKAATVKLDGRQPLSLSAASAVIGPLRRGPHRVEISDSSGQRFFITTAHIPAADTLRLRARFTQLDAPVRISVSTFPPAAEVFVDGYPVGYSPLYNLPVEPGSHIIAVKKDGYREISDSHRLAPAKAYSLHYPLQPEDKAQENR
ncbi:MAG TPA: PEGA domain-containing protein [Caldithrix abyssi]|uniref:non-specific serine/threonine protein kinase n=1 Tax=Caldithrix abyssi TaxID=187145 RepID=A0A7V4U134_CALAY|nr:PEGA domain-containing protein [Caldithrix abyssi]